MLILTCFYNRNNIKSNCFYVNYKLFLIVSLNVDQLVGILYYADAGVRYIRVLDKKNVFISYTRELIDIRGK